MNYREKDRRRHGRDEPAGKARLRKIGRMRSCSSRGEDMRDLAITAAKEGGKILLDSLKLEKRVELKDSGTYAVYAQHVSDVDLKSEKRINELIMSRYPEHKILAEEAGEIGQDSDYVWLIDSLDGTVQYIRHLPYFSLSIALQWRNEIVLGVVYNPCLDELFVAEKGKGAVLNDRPIHVSDMTDLNEAFIASSAFGSYRIARKEKVFYKVMSSIPYVRIYGSPAIDLCYVADGRFDARITSNTEPWDHSAGCLIVEEAGGKVTDWYGNPWSPWSTQLLATNKSLHEKLLKFISRNSL